MLVLESHLDLLDLLLAEREEYRALWARHGATWVVNDIQIHIPSVTADAPKTVTVSTVTLGVFADRIKSLPETLALEAVRASGLRPVPGRIYLADQAGLSQFSEQRLETLRSERTSPFELS